MRLHLLDFHAGEPNRGTASLARMLGGVDRVWDVRRTGELPDRDDGAWVLTGGPGSPLEAGSWREPLAAALRWRVAHDLPTLAICYGFELLGWATGARLALLPRPRLGLHPLELSAAGQDDPILQDLGHASSFEDRRWGVYGGSGETLAWGPDGDRAAARYAARVVGVIFHPEADADGVRGWLAAAGERLAEVDSLHGPGAAARMAMLVDDPERGPDPVHRAVVTRWLSALR